jgi:hypothetical protein
MAPPRFYKLEFTTYDCAEDPLNCLNHCEQFFRGQRTLASDRVWLASYHLTGVAQTWYYALEQDEGMPTWDHFKELCNLRFAPAVCGTRLSELARLPFLSTVQDYSDRFNTVLCHARNLSAPPRRRDSLWAAYRSTSKLTWTCANLRICRQPCTLRAPSSVTPWP